MANILKRLSETTVDAKIVKQVDDVKLIKTTLQDAHIVRIMQHVTGGDQAKHAALEAEIKERIEKLDCVAKVSPILYEAALDNIVETVLFDKFWEKPKKLKFTHAAKDEHRNDQPDNKPAQTDDLKADVTGGRDAPEVTAAPKFNVITFNKLVDKIRVESRSFFPLRNMVDFHIIHHPAFTIVGDGINEKLEARYGHIATAAATADGTFLFNVKFCQALLDFAHLKGIKASDTRYGKKYISQGGQIPDEWEYIEFLIRHEIMHYTYSDFHYQKVIPDANPKLINWVGDFRSNHRLVHQGFNQLPMGLFSSYVNFHKQSSYQEMYNLVKNEFAKLKGQCQDELEEEFDGQTDDHSEGGKNKDGGDKQVDRNVKPEDIDKWGKKVDDKQKGESADAPPDYDNKPPQDRDPGETKGGKHPLDYAQISPRYKWDALLKKMIGETAYTLDQSYQKISRRAIGTMQQVITRGRGAVKPGEVKNPNKKKIKLAVIIDSSGSMSYVIKTVMANLDKLLVQRQGVTGVHDEFYLFIFSGDYDIYECTPGKSGHANNILDVDKHAPGPLGKLKLPEVLANHKSGGTVFSSGLAGQISKLASRGYNCLVVSDGDMLHGSNFTNFKKLYDANRRHVWLLLDSNDTFTQFVSKMKEISNNASHL